MGRIAGKEEVNQPDVATKCSVFSNRISRRGLSVITNNSCISKVLLITTNAESRSGDIG